jgi:hypothetical protein
MFDPETSLIAWSIEVDTFCKVHGPHQPSTRGPKPSQPERETAKRRSNGLPAQAGNP